MFRIENTPAFRPMPSHRASTTNRVSSGVRRAEDIIRDGRKKGGDMTLAEELRNKYALTSFKTKSMSMPLLAINETLEAAAKIADQEHSPIVASRIRSLKWVDRSMALISVPQGVSLTKPA